jgi:hypothetical protein
VPQMGSGKRYNAFLNGFARIGSKASAPLQKAAFGTYGALTSKQAKALYSKALAAGASAVANAAMKKMTGAGKKKDVRGRHVDK